MNGSVEEITQNADGTISFNFVAEFAGGGGNNNDTTTVDVEGALFYESFNDCNADGGNDDQWSGTIANGEFNTDNEGWDAEKGFGANQCAKFGTSKVAGSATTPAFAVNGTATLSFKAGAWDTTSDVTTLSLSAEGATITPTSVEMERGAFTDFTATITANGNVKVTFEVQVKNKNQKGRFFLDEVLVIDPNANAIQTVSVNQKQTRIYTLDGRYAGTDFSTLKHGLYIINGKKVVK